MNKKNTVNLTELNELVADPNFQTLCGFKGEPNVFDIADLREIKNSQMIAWLLDGNESHNCGDKFLKRLLFEVVNKTADEGGNGSGLYHLKNDFNNINILNFSFQDALVITEYPTGKGNEAVDICIYDENSEVIIFIENKIGSKEGRNQRKRYLKALSKKYTTDYFYPIYIYLDYYGENTQKEEEGWLFLNFEWIIEELKNSLTLKTVEGKVFEVFKDYYEYLEGKLFDNRLEKEINNKYKSIRESHDNIIQNLSKLLNKYHSYSFSDYIQTIVNEDIDESEKSLLRFYFKYSTVIDDIMSTEYFEVVFEQLIKNTNISKELADYGSNYIWVTLNEKMANEEYCPIFLEIYENKKKMNSFKIVIRMDKLSSEEIHKLEANRDLLIESKILNESRKLIKGKSNYLHIFNQEGHFDIQETVSNMMKYYNILYKILVS